MRRARAWRSQALTPDPLTEGLRGLALPTRARLAEALGGPLPGPGQRIGLLGGSFNPAHSGHQDITQEALRSLRLNAVWWLVSPQNPLKPTADMAPLTIRLEQAQILAGELAEDRRIRVTALEATLGTVYTADTLVTLRRLFPRVRFVWLMGADNLTQITHWHDWEKIFQTVGVAVFGRPSYSLRALTAKAARRFAQHRLPTAMARRLVDREPPAWVFIRNRLNPQSSTQLRATAGKQR